MLSRKNNKGVEVYGLDSIARCCAFGLVFLFMGAVIHPLCCLAAGLWYGLILVALYAAKKGW